MRKKINRDTFDRYFKLTCVIEQLFNYFHETRKDESASFPRFYEFCNYFLNNNKYEFTKISLSDAKDKLRKYYEGNEGIYSEIPERTSYLCWEIKYNGKILSEDEIFELYKRFTSTSEIEDEVEKDVEQNQYLFTEEQNILIQTILKLFVNINGQFMFMKENGEFDPERVVKLPYSNIPVSIQQIREIRGILKRDLIEQQEQ